MNVYALFTGEYDDRRLLAVYSSLKRAQLAAPQCVTWEADWRGQDGQWWGKDGAPYPRTAHWDIQRVRLQQ